MAHSTDDSLTVFDDSMDLWDVTVLPTVLRDDDTDQDADDFLELDTEGITNMDTQDSHSLKIVNNATKNNLSHRSKEPLLKSVDQSLTTMIEYKRFEGGWCNSQELYLSTHLKTCNLNKCSNCIKCQENIYLLNKYGFECISKLESKKRDKKCCKLLKTRAAKSISNYRRHITKADQQIAY